MGTPIAVIYQLPSDLAEPLYVDLETLELCTDLDGVQIPLRCDDNYRPLLQRWLDKVAQFSALPPRCPPAPFSQGDKHDAGN